jgi:hypothetical protein
VKDVSRSSSGCGSKEACRLTIFTHFGVSTVTIRNDLAFLEKQGIAVACYGGALICDGNTWK